MFFVILLILIVEDNYIGSRYVLLYGKFKLIDNDLLIFLGFMDIYIYIKLLFYIVIGIISF